MQLAGIEINMFRFWLSCFEIYHRERTVCELQHCVKNAANIAAGFVVGEGDGLGIHPFT